MNRRTPSISLQQATLDSPTLSHLTERVMESSARLKLIQDFIPATLRSTIKAGPLEDGVWCLIVANNAVAAKMRQLLPSIEAHLRTKNRGVTSIRLKVQTTSA